MIIIGMLVMGVLEWPFKSKRAITIATTIHSKMPSLLYLQNDFTCIIYYLHNARFPLYGWENVGPEKNLTNSPTTTSPSSCI